MFEAALVAWIVGLLADKALSKGKVLALGRSDQVALQAALRLACQALLDDVPIRARESLALALNERFSEPPAIVYDGVSSVTDFLIRDLRLRIAPLADPDIAPTGRSYFEEIGVDGVALADQLPERIVRSIQQVAAWYPALHPLSAQINSDLILDRVDKILDAVQHRTTAPVQLGTVGISASNNPRPLSVNRLALMDSLITAILDVPSMSDRDSRRAIINILKPAIKDAIPQNPAARIEVLNTIRTCQNFSGGLRELVGAIRLIEGSSKAMANLDATILRIGESPDIDVDG
jgi:hypothetical protein